MQDYSAVEKITVTSSPKQVNAMLADCWRLLDIFHDSDGLPLYVLGDQCDTDMREFLGCPKYEEGL